MNIIEFADTLTDAECVACINDYVFLADNGTLGDCVLRNKAEEYANMIDDIISVKWMDRLVGECHRRFALRYIADNGMTASDDGPSDSVNQ